MKPEECRDALLLRVDDLLTRVESAGWHLGLCGRLPDDFTSDFDIARSLACTVDPDIARDLALALDVDQVSARADDIVTDRATTASFIFGICLATGLSIYYIYVSGCVEVRGLGMIFFFGLTLSNAVTRDARSACAHTRVGALAFVLQRTRSRLVTLCRMSQDVAAECFPSNDAVAEAFPPNLMKIARLSSHLPRCLLSHDGNIEVGDALEIIEQRFRKGEAEPLLLVLFVQRVFIAIVNTQRARFE